MLFAACPIAVYTQVVMGLFGFIVRIASHCLVYDNPAGIWPGMELIYLLVTCGAFFIATDDRIHWIGVANLAGFGVAASFFSLNLPSVWCFCAAVICSLIYWYIRARIRESRNWQAEQTLRGNRPRALAQRNRELASR